MVTRSVTKNNRGFSLVEFMVAALLSGIALSTIGGVVISTQKAVSDKNKQILLLQNMSTVLQQLKEDLLRAGFDTELSESAKFLNTSNVMYTQASPNVLGYVYKVRSESNPEYRHVLYWLNSDTSSLMLCEKSRPTFITVYTAATAYGNCYSVFDPQQISVDKFTINRHQLVGANNVKSAYIAVHLSAYLTKSPEINQNLTIKVTQRNWHE